MDGNRNNATSMIVTIIATLKILKLNDRILRRDNQKLENINPSKGRYLNRAVSNFNEYVLRSMWFAICVVFITASLYC